MKRDGAGMREAAEDLVRQAAEAGMENPWRLLKYTPAEIEAEFDALAAARRMQAQNADLLAWLAGRYVMIGMHAPRRYPGSPNAVSCVPRSMSDMQMKRVFEHIAAKRRDEYGDS